LNAERKAFMVLVPAWELIEREGFARKIEDVGEADSLSQTALRGSLEVLDLAHPAGQWVPSGENLGHQL
jgi:hypothetical protein